MSIKEKISITVKRTEYITVVVDPVDFLSSLDDGEVSLQEFSKRYNDVSVNYDSYVDDEGCAPESSGYESLLTNIEVVEG